MKPQIIIALVILSLALSGCQSAPGPEKEFGHVVAPMADEGDVWDYLEQKYDADRDGIITKAEYDREGDRFHRLDHNKDGAISADDFSSGFGSRRGMRRRMRARRLVAQYFQYDEDPTTLTLEELELAMVAYDANGDHQLDRDEFEATAESRKIEILSGDFPMMRMRMRRFEPWDGLLAGTDDDGDGIIGHDELVGYFNAEADGDRVWNLDRLMRGRGSSMRRGGGVREGEMAPDFELKSSHGGESVSLSSFRGNLPVALIFGSYT